jgi:hypothetical protein
MVRILRHRQTKGPDSARPHLNRRATPRLHLRTPVRGILSAMGILQQASWASGASRSMKIASAHKSLISRLQPRHFHGKQRCPQTTTSGRPTICFRRLISPSAIRRVQSTGRFAIAILFSMFRESSAASGPRSAPECPTWLLRPRSSPKACWARKPRGRRSAA